MDIWRLPGPASFIDDVEHAIRDGSNVIIRFPLGIPGGLEHELRDRLISELEWHHIDSSFSNLDPLEFLLQKVCPGVSAFDVGSITELAAHSSFQGKLIWVEKIDNEMWPAWSTFLKFYSDACRNVDLLSRTTFIVLLAYSG